MRLIYLDNLRAVLMVLGLVLHTCAAFSPKGYWIVTYQEPLLWVDALNDFIHIFRMPLFFMVSGYFAFLLMQKQSVFIFSRTKLLRIGLPFLSVLLIINLPQYLFIENIAESSEQYNVQNIDLRAHLWFLVNLLVYFLLYVLIHRLIFSIKTILDKYGSAAVLIGMILVVPVFYLAVLALNKVGIPIYRPIPILGSIFVLMGYFDYFLLGSLFACLGHNTLLSTLKSRHGVLLLVVLFVFSHLYLLFPGVINSFSEPYLEHIQAIFLSLIIWLVGERFLQSNSLFFKRFADASYSIYLFHHAIIILLVLGLNYIYLNYQIAFNQSLLFVSVILITLALTVFIHFCIVRRFQFCSLIFNGKQAKKAK